MASPGFTHSVLDIRYPFSNSAETLLSVGQCECILSASSFELSEIIQQLFSFSNLVYLEGQVHQRIPYWTLIAEPAFLHYDPLVLIHSGIGLQVSTNELIDGSPGSSILQASPKGQEDATAIRQVALRAY
jgi:hypothetical protein